MDSIEVEQIPAVALFVFIGARPYTEWLGDRVLKNEKGFILTGTDLMTHPDFKRNWTLRRDPFSLETCQPGLFAAGDVRANAMNRVASAVGKGAMAVSFVHKYLSEV